MSGSVDAPAPPWGPPFLRLTAWPYRAEWWAGLLAVLAILFGWRLAFLHALSLEDVLLIVFWAAWPDLLAFLPIGLAGSGPGRWPSWGPSLYNVGHSLLVWAAIFALWSWATGQIVWPLLGWAGHIAADRAAGFHLRTRATDSASVGRPAR